MRLGKWHRRIVIAALGLVGISGVLWFMLHDVMNRAPDDLLHGLLVAHGVTAYLSAAAFGSVLPLHVIAGWRYRRHLVSGFASVLAIVLLIGSALLLYYGGEETQAWARLVHIATGLGAVLAVPIHVVLGRRLRKQTDLAETRRVLMR